jgi:hypothetical protein
MHTIFISLVFYEIDGKFGTINFLKCILHTTQSKQKMHMPEEEGPGMARQSNHICLIDDAWQIGSNHVVLNVDQDKAIIYVQFRHFAKSYRITTILILNSLDFSQNFDFFFRLTQS